MDGMRATPLADLSVGSGMPRLCVVSPPVRFSDVDRAPPGGFPRATMAASKPPAIAGEPPPPHQLSARASPQCPTPLTSPISPYSRMDSSS